MLEIPEAVTISNQIDVLLKGKRVKDVIVAYSPHKFAWYVDAGVAYKSLLEGLAVESAFPSGGMVEIKVGPCRLVFSDGVALRYFTAEDGPPKKHQLLLTFDDKSHLSASVQMYGGLICFHELDGYDNFYYQVSHEKPSPLSEEFNEKY
ncbi:MAG: hypothetical protein MUO40_08985, partial [Anaerolineaceae bacterium]|nr:hypothetical protein [Anaerolineaceae bacterium]